MPKNASLLSLNTTFWSSAVSVVVRSIVREFGVAAEHELRRLLEQRVVVGRHPLGLDRQLALVAPLLASTIFRWKIVPIFGAARGLMASELFQKSRPLTSPWFSHRPTWCG